MLIALNTSFCAFKPCSFLLAVAASFPESLSACPVPYHLEKDNGDTLKYNFEVWKLEEE